MAAANKEMGLFCTWCRKPTSRWRTERSLQVQVRVGWLLPRRQGPQGYECSWQMGPRPPTTENRATRWFPHTVQNLVSLSLCKCCSEKKISWTGKLEIGSPPLPLAGWGGGRQSSVNLHLICKLYTSGTRRGSSLILIKV